MRQKKSRKGLIFNLIMLPIIIIFAVGLIWQSTNPDNFFSVFGFRSYLIAYTGSMEPELKHNDLILVKRYDFEQLKVGDIITFYGKTTRGEVIPITHKIVEIVNDKSDNRTYIRTKGTNLAYSDLIPVTVDGAEDTNKYIGKMVKKSTILGNLTAYIRSWQGLLAISINLACIIGIRVVIGRLRKDGEN